MDQTNLHKSQKMKKPIHIPLTDLEESHQRKESIENVLISIGDGLNYASELLDNLEQDGMLGPAIRRYASDLALVVGNVARDLDCGDDSNHNSEDISKQKKWARAIIQDANNQLALEESSKNGTRSDSLQQIQRKGNNDKSAAGLIAELEEDDIINAMKAAKTILLDIEEALKDISVDDAEEIADVGLVVAKMFLWGLQNVQNQVVHTMIANGSNSEDLFTQKNSKDTSLEIEIIADDEDGENGTDRSSRARKSQLKDNRMKVLWPPIGPAVISVASWGKSEAIKNPVLSIALAMALWPTAVVVAFIGTPILTIDYALQAGYNAVEDQPLIQNIERSAANLCQVGKLYFLVSKLMVKQSVRVGKRQIERRGGIHKVVEDLGHWTIDRVTHPIESAGMAWNTFNAGIGIVAEAISVVKDAAMGDIETTNMNLNVK